MWPMLPAAAWADEVPLAPRPSPEVKKRVTPERETAAVEARCVARALIDPNGLVTSVDVKGCDGVAADAVRTVLPRWKFYPYRVARRALPVPVQVAVVFVFLPRGELQQGPIPPATCRWTIDVDAAGRVTATPDETGCAAWFPPSTTAPTTPLTCTLRFPARPDERVDPSSCPAEAQTWLLDLAGHTLMASGSVGSVDLRVAAHGR